ncbi:DUF4411 family protein [Marinospirillum sp.]
MLILIYILRRSTIVLISAVKVPNVCQKYDVQCISTFELLKRLQAKFVL